MTNQDLKIQIDCIFAVHKMWHHERIEREKFHKWWGFGLLAFGMAIGATFAKVWM